MNGCAHIHNIDYQNDFFIVKKPFQQQATVFCTIIASLRVIPIKQATGHGFVGSNRAWENVIHECVE